MKKIIALCMTICILITCIFTGQSVTENVEGAVRSVTTAAMQANDLLNGLVEEYTTFVFMRNKQLGGSHYAYTEALSDEMINTKAPDGVEYNFNPGSEMVLLELSKNGSTITRKETVLLESTTGVLRDPDVSEDGTRVLFSWKKDSADDYHLYEYDLKTEKTTQITFGSGIADIEPKYLPNGKIAFCSTRIIQTVDCWKTPVSNIYVCDADGKNITRLGYDQVHVTYPTVTSDGRVLYTRWDYNDRSQMYVQGVFQMFQDGTNQTEVYGNNSNFPCTLLHTREIPGSTDKYISIASGHHVPQAGKLVIVDTSKGRNSKDAISFVVNDGSSNKNDNIDAYGQSGALYKYPYAVNENLFIASYCESGWASNRNNTPFGLYLFDANGNKTELVPGNSSLPATQIVPVADRTMFERASMVNYAKDTGTYYIGNIYEGDGLKEVEKGTAKYLRVVALDYRSYAIGATNASGTGTSDPYTPVSTGNGAWDVKKVLGIVPIEKDGSVLFNVPSETPVYFQVLDANGDVMQSMRSWSTLMPGESFSCVGCHEDKNTVPPAASSTTMAMAKGVQTLQADFWQTGENYENYNPYTDAKGFDYLEEVQPILDESCVKCHTNKDESYTQINASAMPGAEITSKSEVEVIPAGSTWKYYMSSSNNVANGWNTLGFHDDGWNSATAPFGDREGYATSWTGDNKYIWLRKTFTIENLAEFQDCNIALNTYYDDNPQFYLNGHLIYKDTQGDPWVDEYTKIQLGSDYAQYLVEGTNVIAIQCSNDTGGRQIDTALSLTKVKRKEKEVVSTGSEWKYYMSTSNNVAGGWNTVGFNDSGWPTAKAPFGDRENHVTAWEGNNKYIWIRKNFTIDDLSDFDNCRIKLNTWYDDNPQFYLNGHLIYTDTEGNPWVDKYTTITLGQEYSQYLVEGNNVIAIQCSNDTGGRQIDTGLTLVQYEKEPQELLSIRSAGWKYQINNNPGSGWMKEEYDDSLWRTGSAPFGGFSNCQTSWTGDDSDIWLRRTFTVDNLQNIKKMKMSLDIFYDEDPTVYINGKEVFNASGYLTQYKTYDLLQEFTSYLKKGENTIAIHAHNSYGGLFIDVGLSMKSPSAEPFSLESTDVIGMRMKRYFPLSYLVLTGSTVSGTNWIGNSTNNYTNWISSMSQCEILKPYAYGSHKSNIIRKLRSGHGNLTDTEIRTIAAWIDLGVPAYGTYDANNAWDGNAIRWAEQYTNKRAFYDMMNDYSRKTLAGTIEGGELSINYAATNGKRYSVNEAGLATLYVDKSYTAGDKVTITLPAGEKYLMVCLNSMMGEELVYVPGGKFTYTIPNNTNVYPPTFSTAVTNTITARIPTEEELTGERNLAQNIYDLSGATNTYPHATARSEYANNAQFLSRNAIDGFTANTGHGDYPYQSWGPDHQNGYQWIKIDFGREVYVNEVELYIRADFPHDVHYTSATLEFSNGTEKNITMKKTKEAQTYSFDTVKTSYVIVKNLVPSDSSTSVWEGLMEVKANGYIQKATEENGCDWTLDEENALIYDVPMGTDIDAFKAGFDTEVTVYKDGQEMAGGRTGTGMTVEYQNKTYHIVIVGDLEGNGYMTVSDVVKLRRYTIMKNLTPLQIKAGDLTGDGKLSVADVKQLRSDIMEKK